MLRCCYDIVLIDGRFREACAIKALKFAHNGTVVMIHDAQRYVDHRPVKDNYRVLSILHSLVVLQPRAAALAKAHSDDEQLSAELANKLQDIQRRERRI